MRRLLELQRQIRELKKEFAPPPSPPDSVHGVDCRFVVGLDLDRPLSQSRLDNTQAMDWRKSSGCSESPSLSNGTGTFRELKTRFTSYVVKRS